MKNTLNQGWLFDNRRFFPHRFVVPLTAMALMTLTGCSWLKDYTNPPIIDASQQPNRYGQQGAAYTDPRNSPPADRYGRTSPYNRPAPVQQNNNTQAFPVATDSLADPQSQYPQYSQNAINAQPNQPGMSQQSIPEQLNASLQQNAMRQPTGNMQQSQSQYTSMQQPPAGNAGSIPVDTNSLMTSAQPDSGSYPVQTQQYNQSQTMPVRQSHFPTGVPVNAPAVSDVRVSETNRQYPNFPQANAATQNNPPYNNSAQPPATANNLPRKSSTPPPQADITSLSTQNQYIPVAPTRTLAKPAVAESQHSTTELHPTAESHQTVTQENQTAAPAETSVTHTTPAEAPAVTAVESPASIPQPAITAIQPASTNAPSHANISANSAPEIRTASASAPVAQPKTAAPSDDAINIAAVQVMLERYLKQQPNDTNVQLALRYLYQAQGQNDKASEPIKDIPIEQQTESLRLAKAFLLAQQAAGKTSRDNPALINQAVQSLNQLQSQIAENADLEIVNLKLCQDAARGFGQYNPIDPDQLSSTKSKTIWIYFELKNFQTQHDEGGKYTSRVAADIALYDDQYRMIKQMLQAEVPDESWNRRTDFYLHAGPLKLPDLAPGKYQLVVSVEDKIGNKSARPARYDFEIKPDKQK